jgi:hypothetical protein
VLPLLGVLRFTTIAVPLRNLSLSTLHLTLSSTFTTCDPYTTVLVQQ